MDRIDGNKMMDEAKKTATGGGGGAGEMTEAVRMRYNQVAGSGLTGRSAGVRDVAAAFGYSEAELGSLPEGANLGLSCGNPTAMASLRAGEVVVDLGCGGGLDVFLAAQKVGESGRAIGIDMTPGMIARAKANAQHGPDGIAYGNVEFYLAAIDALPLASETVDCVISNCVINLAADKHAVFREMFRVLKPGGRVAISDIALRKELPAELAQSVAAWVGCIAGAIGMKEYREGLLAAGFTQVEVVDGHADLNAYKLVENQSGCCSPAMGDDQGDDQGDDRVGGAFEAAAGAAAVAAGAADSLGQKTGFTLQVQMAACCGGGGGTGGADARAASGVHRDLRALAERYDLNEFAASVKVFAIKGS